MSGGGALAVWLLIITLSPPSADVLMPTDLYREAGEVDAGADHPLIVVRVDADGVRLEVEGVLAVLDLLQLVLVQVGPPPDAGVDHMREPFPARNLDKDKLPDYCVFQKYQC